MKNNIMRISVISIILIAIFTLKANVFAANDSYKTNLSVDHSQVQRNEYITVTISLSDIAIESGEKGIGAYTAGIEFDSSIFEFSSTEGTDNWETPFYQDKLILGNTNNGKVVKTSQNIGKIIFKVKDNAKLGETIIKLTNFSGSNASTDLLADDTSVKVTIIDKNDENESNGNQNENGSGNNETQSGNVSQNNGNQNGNNSENNVTQNGNISENNGNQNGNGSGNSNTNNEGENVNTNNANQNNSGNININDAKKDDMKEGILPQSGDKNMTLLILISTFVIVAICLFIKIKLINKKIKKII